MPSTWRRPCETWAWARRITDWTRSSTTGYWTRRATWPTPRPSIHRSPYSRSTVRLFNRCCLLACRLRYQLLTAVRLWRQQPEATARRRPTVFSSNTTTTASAALSRSLFSSAVRRLRSRAAGFLSVWKVRTRADANSVTSKK